MEVLYDITAFIDPEAWGLLRANKDSPLPPLTEGQERTQIILGSPEAPDILVVQRAVWRGERFWWVEQERKEICRAETRTFITRAPSLQFRGRFACDSLEGLCEMLNLVGQLE